jgi:hypothetical protein
VWTGGPTPRGAAAITLGRLIIVDRISAAATDRWQQLIDHELHHVQQWRRLGVVRFVLQYVSSYARWRIRGYGHWAAYRRIPLEIEARWATRATPRSQPRSEPAPVGYSAHASASFPRSPRTF